MGPSDGLQLVFWVQMASLPLYTLAMTHLQIFPLKRQNILWQVTDFPLIVSQVSIILWN